MKELAKLVGILTLICLMSGLLLAWVHRVTEEPIREAKRRQTLAALEQVLPPHDNRPDETIVPVLGADGQTNLLFYVATLNGAYTGAAWETATDQGYGGEIRIMIGVNSDGAVQGIEILPGHKETPGLGAKIRDDSFKSQFANKPMRETVWKVSKDGGAIDAITAATVSSKAVTEAVALGLADYQSHEPRLRETRGEP